MSAVRCRPCRRGSVDEDCAAGRAGGTVLLRASYGFFSKGAPAPPKV
jgi:hypothetical protein